MSEASATNYNTKWRYWWLSVIIVINACLLYRTVDPVCESRYVVMNIVNVVHHLNPLFHLSQQNFIFKALGHKDSGSTVLSQLPCN